MDRGQCSSYNEMTNLFEKCQVHVPVERARELLAETLEGVMQGSDPALTRLSVSYPGGEVSKNVLVTYRKAIDPTRASAPWDVLWTPEGGGPFPDFDGALTIQPNADGTAMLELHGAYIPPLGAAGVVFDAVLGSKIASATAQTLLAQIAREIEERAAKR